MTLDRAAESLTSSRNELCSLPPAILGLGSAAVSHERGGWVWQKSEDVHTHQCLANPIREMLHGNGSQRDSVVRMYV